MIYTIITLIVLVLFYGSYFYKKIKQSSKGIVSDQLGQGKTGFCRMIEIAVKVVTIAVVGVEVISIYQQSAASLALLKNIGLILEIIGLIFFISALFTMKDSWRAGVAKGDSTQLITNGIFQISRNPAFLGFDLLDLGIAMVFFNYPLWIISFLSVLIFHLQIVNNEEPYLMEAFGQEYMNYTKSINRYLGKKRGK